MTKLAKKVEESKASTSLTNKKAKDDEPMGKDTISPPEAKKPKPIRVAIRGIMRLTAPREGTSKNPGKVLEVGAFMMASAAVPEKILDEVILLADKEKIDKLSLDQVSPSSFRSWARYLFTFILGFNLYTFTDLRRLRKPIF